MKSSDQLLKEARAAEMNGDLATAKSLREKAYLAGKRAAPETDEGNGGGGILSAPVVKRPGFNASSGQSQEGGGETNSGVSPQDSTSSSEASPGSGEGDLNLS